MRSSALLQRAGAPVPGVSSVPPESSGRPVAALEFEAVYAQHFDFIWRSVRGLGVPLGAVDDVTQDIFVIVHRKLDSLASPDALRSWLFGIARRVCKDHRRSATRRGIHVTLDNNRDVDITSDPQQRAAHRQALRVVERFADSLDDERRALFFLAFVEGLPTADVAVTLELNPSTTYSRVRALRAELALLLDTGEQNSGENHA
jgi:RNA polymerase sigma-70 factor, ECF subfamily